MNYGDIKSHFDALLNRSDITAALTTLFVDQSIARIQRQLRIPINENKTTYTISGQTAFITLPTDFLEIISLYHGGVELNRVPNSKMRGYANNPVAGTPLVFTREQQKLLLHPQPSSGDLILYYYGEFAPMVANSDENDLAKVAPDLIIYGALGYAADYYLDERRDIFEAKFVQFITELQEQANDQELHGGTQAIQPSVTYTDYQSTPSVQ
tara:strand:- start:444 stop:1076 length:633 start_codon:yes stop_codon:yes gene_type:complete